MRNFSVRLFLFCLIFTGCASNSDEQKVQKIMAEINALQNKQETITKDMLGKPNIFSSENLNNFPDNRNNLEFIATEQVSSLNQIIELDREQITKLNEIETFRLDNSFIEYSSLSRRIFEKRLEDKELGVKKFQLILNKNIVSKQQLESNISDLKLRQVEIDLEILNFENQKLNIRKTTGK